MKATGDAGKSPARRRLSENEALKRGTKVTPTQFFTRHAATRAKAWL